MIHIAVIDNLTKRAADQPPQPGETPNPTTRKLHESDALL